MTTSNIYIIKSKEESEIWGIYTDKQKYKNNLEYLINCEYEGDKEMFDDDYEYGTLEELGIEFNNNI